MIENSLFIAITAIYVAYFIFYLWNNNWAKEALDVLIPFIGAILLSSYAVLKLFYLDVPEPLKFSEYVVSYQDATSGVLRGVPSIYDFARKSNFTSLDMFEGRGTKAINSDHAIKLGLQKQLIPRGTESIELLNYIIEQAILQWLAFNMDLNIGVKDRRKVTLVSSSSGSMSPPPENLVAVPINTHGMESNPHLKEGASPIYLPTGSSVSRNSELENKYKKSFSVQTRTSKLTVTISMYSSEPFDISQILDDIKRSNDNQMLKEQLSLYKALVGATSNDRGKKFLHTSIVEFEFTQAPFTRFSHQAKEEIKWATYLQSQFTKDFGWTYLKAKMLEK